MSETPEHIGTRVRAARKAAGLPRNQLAEISGLGYWSIVKIETGGARPSQESAGRIAEALGIEVAALTCADGVLPEKPLRRRGLRGSSWSVEYFWQRVDRRGADECWPWTRALNGKGYGNVTFRGETTGAHRVAYELTVGPIADGLEIDHTCHDPNACQALGDDCLHRRCCNPAHLKPVTHAVNVKRRRPGGGGGRRPRQGHPRVPNPGITVSQRFGLYLSAARRQAGLTQAELGEMVGMAESSICNIEAGRRGAREGHRAAFTTALNLDAEDLLRYLNSVPAANPGEAGATPRFLDPEPLFDLEAAS